MLKGNENYFMFEHFFNECLCKIDLTTTPSPHLFGTMLASLCPGTVLISSM
jgi:hypothetical protein